MKSSVDVLLEIVGGRSPLAVDDCIEDELVRQAAQHGMLGALNGTTDSRGLQGAQMLAAARNLAYAGLLNDFGRALKPLGVPYLVIKGPAIATLVYEDLSARPFTDLDILVPAHRQPEVLQVLKVNGFDLDQRIDPRYHGLNDSKHISVSRGPMRVEIHSRLFEGVREPSFCRFWTERQRFKIGDSVHHTLGLGHTVWHLAVHGNGHRFSSLKWLDDFARLVQDDTSQESTISAWQTAKETRTEAPLLASLLLLERINLSPSGSHVKRLRPKRSVRRAASRLADDIVAGWHGPSASALTSFNHKLHSLGLADRCRHVWHSVLRPTASDWRTLPWLPPSTPIVFNLLRPLRIAFKYTLGPSAENENDQYPVYFFDKQ